MFAANSAGLVDVMVRNAGILSDANANFEWVMHDVIEVMDKLGQEFSEDMIRGMMVMSEVTRPEFTKTK